MGVCAPAVISFYSKEKNVDINTLRALNETDEAEKGGLIKKSRALFWYINIKIKY